MRKLGEKVLPEIIPILEDGLLSDRPDQRQGVCIGLSEIMNVMSRDHVSSYYHFSIVCKPIPIFRKHFFRFKIFPKNLEEIIPLLGAW